MQPNSTARTIVNVALTGLGVALPIVSDVAYTLGIVSLPSYVSASDPNDKYQSQAITWLDLVHRQLGLTMNKPEFYRRFKFTTAANQSQYTLNNQIVEGFRPNSFFNVTYAAGPGNQLGVIPYERMMQMYARPDTIPIGTPLWLVPIPKDGTEHDGSQSPVVQLVPTPDQAYVIEGQCRLIVQPIKSGADQVAFPYFHEHALIMKLIEMLEGRLDEGRDQSARMYAEQFVAEVLRDATGAEEEVDRIDIGFSLYGRESRNSARDYNALTDTVTQWP